MVGIVRKLGMIDLVGMAELAGMVGMMVMALIVATFDMVGMV